MRKMYMLVVLLVTIVTLSNIRNVNADFYADANNQGFYINSNYEAVEKMYDTMYKNVHEYYYPNGVREYTTEIYSAMLQDSRNTSYNVIIYRVNFDPGKSKKWSWFRYIYVENFAYKIIVDSPLQTGAELIDFSPKNDINTYSGTYTTELSFDNASISASYDGFKTPDMQIVNDSSWGDDTYHCLYEMLISTDYTKGPSSHYGMFIYQYAGLSTIPVTFDVRYKLYGRVGDDVFGGVTTRYYSDSRWYD